MNKEEQAALDLKRAQDLIDARHRKEEAARPNLLHRAIVFLLRETAANNRDTKREADYYIGVLDQELADADELRSIEAAAAAAIPAEGGPAAPNRFDTASAVGKSKRFRKNVTPSAAKKATAATDPAPKIDPALIPTKQASRFRRS